MELAPARIWSLIQNTESLESYTKHIIGDVYINQRIEPDLVQQIEQVKKLLHFSYYEYSFLDLALLHAIFTLEKSIKHKRKELDPNFSTKTNFKALYEWCFQNDLFEANNSDFLEQLRRIRNGKVHDYNPSQGGLVFVKKVLKVILLINDLYEDTNLRKQRNTEKEFLNDFFSTQLQKGGIYEFNRFATLIYSVKVVFIFNKNKTKKAWLLIYPKFNLNQNETDLSNSSRPYFIEITNWQINNNEFTASNFDGVLIKIHSLNTDASKRTFLIWKNELNSTNKRFDIYLQKQIINDDYFIEALKLNQKL